MNPIGWTDTTWNPVRGCSRVSPGCDHCYAIRQARRQDRPGGAYEGLTRTRNGGLDWSAQIRLVPEKLDEPLRWRKPRRIFTNSMSDLFHERIPDEFIDRVFAVMALAPQHTFQVLTKPSSRSLAYLTWPLPNVHLGVSVEDQQTADERIPLLLQTPAAVRWVSCEPLLGPVDFSHDTEAGILSFLRKSNIDMDPAVNTKLDWVVVGGESGPGARPCDVSWIWSVAAQCRDAKVPAYVKQLGAYPILDPRFARTLPAARRLRDRKGSDMSEWPSDLRVRQFPEPQ